jgi:dienelactone hydrolase
MQITSSTALALSLVLCASFLSPAATAAERSVNTPRGLPVEMLVDVPDGAGPFPAVVFAPGQGYHARLPLLERTAKDLTSRGVAVIRFNWAYFLKDGNKGKPAEDLATEVEDMKSVLAEARKLPRIDPERVAVAGKSLGSLVAWRVFRADARLRSAALLTPVCTDMTSDSRRDAVLTNHPDITSNTRPLLLLAGDADAICPASFLYGTAATISGGARVVVVGGDHGFATKAGPDAAQESEANMALAVRATANFVAATLQ